MFWPYRIGALDWRPGLVPWIGALENLAIDPYFGISVHFYGTIAMPIYEYECSRCAHRMEALQKISDAPLRDCPACNSPSLQKLVSAASFRLKGTGWYETDFKNKDKPKSETKENSVTSKEGNQEKQGESKKTSGNEAKDTKKADVA